MFHVLFIEITSTLANIEKNSIMVANYVRLHVIACLFSRSFYHLLLNVIQSLKFRDYVVQVSNPMNSLPPLSIVSSSTVVSFMKYVMSAFSLQGFLLHEKRVILLVSFKFLSKFQNSLTRENFNLSFLEARRSQQFFSSLFSEIDGRFHCFSSHKWLLPSIFSRLSICVSQSATRLTLSSIYHSFSASLPAYLLIIDFLFSFFWGSPLC